MAIKNTTTGEYLKITSMQFDFSVGNYHISYLKFKDLDQRQRYENSLSPYEQYFSGQCNAIGVIDDCLQANNDKNNAKDSMFNACYNALKQDIFKDWVDC